MRIAINCRSIMTRRPTGIGRYVRHLITSLAEIDRDNQYTLYVQKKLIDFNRRTPKFSFSNANFQIKKDCFQKGVDSVVGKCDVYHSPYPGLVGVKQAKIIVTVHDLIYKTFPESHTPQTIKQTDEAFNDFLAKADKVICCSESTHRDLHDYFKFPEEKSAVVYQGVDHSIFYPLSDTQKQEAKEVLKQDGIETPFILFVGTVEPRKNLVNLLKAFAMLKTRNQFSGKLVVAGMQGWMSDGNEDLIKKLGLEDSVQFIGYVTDDKLRALYNLAEVFVFPSLYEGFGYPIVEAFACGAAVVTSDLSSCGEVAGDAARLTDPNNPQKLAEDIAAVVCDPKLKMDLMMRGLRRAQEFSFTKTARETLAIYHEVCGLKPPSFKTSPHFEMAPTL